MSERKAKERSQGSDLRAGKEVLLLWAILGEGGGKEVSRSALNDKGMLPTRDKEARDGLAARGLIKAERRKSRNDKGRLINGYSMSVTDAGRAWAEENLAATPGRSQAAAPILQVWLSRLSIFLQARNTPLSEFLGKQSPRVHSHGYDALRERIRQAYLGLTGAKLNTPIRLSDLRDRLKDIDREALDAALARMHLEDGTTLSGLNNPQEITPAIRNGALAFKGEPMYVLWITK